MRFKIFIFCILTLSAICLSGKAFAQLEPLNLESQSLNLTGNSATLNALGSQSIADQLNLNTLQTSGSSGSSDIGTFMNSADPLMYQSPFDFSTVIPSAITPASNRTSPAGAGKGTYQLLEAIPDLPSTPSFTEYAQMIYRYVFGTAIIVAVLALVFAGIQYIGSSTVTSTASAKSRLTSVATGAALALGSWLILNTVNPDLINFQLQIPSLNRTSAQSTSFLDDLRAMYPGSGGGVTSDDPTIQIHNETFEGRYFPGARLFQTTFEQNESAVRDRLKNASEGKVTINNKNVCGSISWQEYRAQNGEGCTNVQGLGMPAQAFIVDLATNKELGCDIVITGGTEVGHTEHGIGNSVFDMRDSGCIRGILTSPSSKMVDAPWGGSTVKGHEITITEYENAGKKIVGQLIWEGGDAPHWHVRVREENL